MGGEVKSVSFHGCAYGNRGAEAVGGGWEVGPESQRARARARERERERERESESECVCLCDLRVRQLEVNAPHRALSERVAARKSDLCSQGSVCSPACGKCRLVPAPGTKPL